MSYDRPDYPRLGTTTPIYISRPQGSGPLVQADEGYFVVRIHAAQAAFRGAIWERAHRLIVTSQVNIHHPALDNQPTQAIQRSREVRRQQAEQLGLSPNLVNLVPATMPQISIAFTFMLDTTNQLLALAGLINSDSFMAPLGLAPGVAATARAIGTVAEKLLRTLLDPQDQRPILQFAGDFNLLGGDLRDGFYAILGSRDPSAPLPPPSSAFDIRNGLLLVDSAPATSLSYIVLEVVGSRWRTRALNNGAAWDVKLHAAEAAAAAMSDDPFSSDTSRKHAWGTCLAALNEARVMLLADANYLHTEALAIVRDVAVACHAQVFPAPTKSLDLGEDESTLEAGLKAIGVPVPGDLGRAVVTYAEEAADCSRALAAAGLQ